MTQLKPIKPGTSAAAYAYRRHVLEIGEKIPDVTSGIEEALKKAYELMKLI
jgi:hypothetical protein